jgi:prophage regulatory protein
MNTTRNRLLRWRDLHAVVGLSHTEVYRRMAAGQFPRQIQLGPKSVAWSETEVTNWIAERVAARDRIAN